MILLSLYFIIMFPLPVERTLHGNGFLIQNHSIVSILSCLLSISNCWKHMNVTGKMHLNHIHKLGRWYCEGNWLGKTSPAILLPASLYTTGCKAQHWLAPKAAQKCFSTGGTIIVLKVQVSINNKRQGNLQAQMLTVHSGLIRSWIHSDLRQEMVILVPDAPFVAGEFGTSLL